MIRYNSYLDMSVVFLLSVLSVSRIAWAACSPKPCELVGPVLVCSDRNLKNMSEISGDICSNLETLLMSGNDLTELGDDAFLLFPNAKVIDLRNNKIHTVSERAFSSLTVLQTLLLDSNLLKDLSSLHLLDVIELHLKGNNLGQNGDLHGLVAPKLEELVMANCALSIFKAEVLSNTSKLTNLDLSNNQLQVLDSSWFTVASSVATLILSDNKIASLNVNNDNLGRLRILDLSNNSPLKTLDDNTIQKMPQLQELLLSGASLQITTDSPLFSHGALTHLSLANALNSMTQLPTSFFSQLPALQWLDLSNNRLFDVEELFNASASLKVVYLSGNGLASITEKIFNGTPRLEELYLDANMALDTFTLSAVSQLANLRVLDVSDTRLACYCSNDLRELQLWTNATAIDFKDSCGNNLPCEWEDTTDTTTTDSPIEKCWDLSDGCPAGQKCCYTGLCSTKCAGAAIGVHPLVILLLLAVLVHRMNR